MLKRKCGGGLIQVSGKTPFKKLVDLENQYIVCQKKLKTRNYLDKKLRGNSLQSFRRSCWVTNFTKVLKVFPIPLKTVESNI